MLEHHVFAYEVFAPNDESIMAVQQEFRRHFISFIHSEDGTIDSADHGILTDGMATFGYIPEPKLNYF